MHVCERSRATHSMRARGERVDEKWCAYTHTATQTILSGSRIGAGVRSRRRRRRTRAHAHMCTMEMRCECERVSVRFPRIASDQVRAAGSGLAWPGPADRRCDRDGARGRLSFFVYKLMRVCVSARVAGCVCVQCIHENVCVKKSWELERRPSSHTPQFRFGADGKRG